MKLSTLAPLLIASLQPCIAQESTPAPTKRAKECAAVAGGCTECVNAGCAFSSTDLLDDGASSCVPACNDEFGIPLGGYENAPNCYGQDMGVTTEEICAVHQQHIQEETDCRGRTTCGDCTSIPIGSTTSCYWANSSNTCTTNSTTSDALLYCPGTQEYSCTYDANSCESCLGFGCSWGKDAVHQDCTAGYCSGFPKFCYNTTGDDFQGMEIGEICAMEAALTADDHHCESHFDCEACQAAKTESSPGCWWDEIGGDGYQCKAMHPSSTKTNMTCPVSTGGQGETTTAPSSAIMHVSSWLSTLALAALMAYGA